MKGWRELYFYISVGVGMALATSVFTMFSGLFASASPLWILIGIVGGGLVSAIIASAIGELAGMYPSAPGVRTYFKAAFGERPSLTLVYLYLLFVVLIAGLESYVFAQVVGAAFPGMRPLSVVLGLLIIVVGVNLAGFTLPRTLQMIVTTLVVGTILIIGTWGSARGVEQLATVFDPGDVGAGIATIPALVGMSIFLFTGYEWVTPLGLRPKAYERKVPWSMPTAVLILALVYLLMVVGIGATLTSEAVAETAVPQVPYVLALAGERGVLIAFALSVGAIFSTFNAGILGGSQLIMLLSREGHLPEWCGRMSLRTGSPIGGIAALGTLATLSAIVVLRYELEILFAMVGSAIMCFVYAAFVLARVILRSRQPGAKRPFRDPVPELVSRGVVVLLPVVGLLTAVSQPGWRRLPLVVLVALAAMSLLVASRAKPSARPVRERSAGLGA